MTHEELKKSMRYASGVNIAKYAQPLIAAMVEFDIDTPIRQAYFLAQVAHESGSLQYVREIASGGAYEGRADLGNTEPGDGVKYKGHGLIETTGKANHYRVADYFGIDRAGIVDWLQTPEGAARSAGLFWHDNNLNVSADADDIHRNTKIINGGTNGILDRIQRLTETKRALGVT